MYLSMRRFPPIFIISIGLIVMIGSCVKPYQPSSIRGGNAYLVVDGALLADSSTVIRLSRTRNLSDTGGTVAENNAQVFIEEESGGIYPFLQTADGEYTLDHPLLTIGVRYRLKILTSNTKHYLSDYVEMKPTPPIDSLQWDQKNDIFIYVNTHDPTNNTRYYRWDFVETSDYNTPFDSFLDFRGGQVVFIQPDEYRTTCYKTFYSKDVLVGSSAALSSDVISHLRINSIANDNSKISDRYSILVKQYALTSDAYQYWIILKQNSEQTGGLFDPQPSQLKGNIHCAEVPDEPVIGYISASSVQGKRIFINNTELSDRKETIYSVLCKETLVARDSAAYYLQDGSFLPAYYISNGPLAIAPKFCVDCRLGGGVTARPPFW